MLWIVLALLTVIVVVWLLRPLLSREVDTSESRGAYDMVVYRDQLAEIEHQIESGMLALDQADAARAEVHRRMLAAEDSELDRQAHPMATDSRRMQLMGVAAIALIVPVGAAAIYGILGSPKLPGEPYTWRASHDPNFAAGASADALAAQVEAHPSVAGYRELAARYFEARNFEQAAQADRHAIDLGADDADIWSGYGESEAMSANGMIVPEAMRAFANALSRSPHDQRARFYVALAEAQIGNLRYAVAILRDLLQSAAPDAPWADMVRSHIASIAKQGGFTPESVTPIPPDVAKLQAAVVGMSSAMASAGGASTPSTAPADKSLSGNDPQSIMIRAMVGRLAARMAQSPDDADGWRRLAHAYVVLGENEKARAAIDHAMKLRPEDPAVLAALAETQQAAAKPGDETPSDFIATLRKVLKLEPDNLEALYYVGLAEQKVGRADVARIMWAKALTGPNDPQDPLIIAIRNRLNSKNGRQD